MLAWNSTATWGASTGIGRFQKGELIQRGTHLKFGSMGELASRKLSTMVQGHGRTPFNVSPGLVYGSSHGNRALEQSVVQPALDATWSMMSRIPRFKRPAPISRSALLGWTSPPLDTRPLDANITSMSGLRAVWTCFMPCTLPYGALRHPTLRQLA